MIQNFKNEEEIQNSLNILNIVEMERKSDNKRTKAKHN